MTTDSLVYNAPSSILMPKLNGGTQQGERADTMKLTKNIPRGLVVMALLALMGCGSQETESASSDEVARAVKATLTAVAGSSMESISPAELRAPRFDTPQPAPAASTVSPSEPRMEDMWKVIVLPTELRANENAPGWNNLYVPLVFENISERWASLPEGSFRKEDMSVSTAEGWTYHTDYYFVRGIGSGTIAVPPGFRVAGHQRFEYTGRALFKNVVDFKVSAEALEFQLHIRGFEPMSIDNVPVPLPIAGRQSDWVPPGQAIEVANKGSLRVIGSAFARCREGAFRFSKEPRKGWRFMSVTNSVRKGSRW